MRVCAYTRFSRLRGRVAVFDYQQIDLPGESEKEDSGTLMGRFGWACRLSVRALIQSHHNAVL